ncbi:MAG TPA: DNA polymerase III subunit gamma/tau [Thermohalobaculum sp.]|nr:DNA polymerase III subunit gamma/tau [Thermohalobaculum sp.]
MSDTPQIDPPSEAAASSPYQVLARKYRPGHFRDLVGQEAMVRTLTNAFAHDRIAHAFILTGVRGVGKTTTARIIAKGLNCTGRGDGPTIDPCGECTACTSIAEGRNVDVLEMDAASNTGVGDVREIIESVRYRAAAARYKVYIIDEVHMLSTSAFNALLKTLEEPPEHVKFVFATTEIRKVPVTVLSRCQRFDLRRIEPEAMLEHLRGIADKEGAAISDEALALITRAAEGSVRDALSLLDQAIAHGHGDEIAGETGAAEVRSMLGLADRGRVFDLFDAIMRGDAKAALEALGAQYADGADPAVVLRDLAELTHWISVLKISAEAAEDPTVSAGERTRGRDFSERLSMRVLTRAWQMLLKAIEEVPIAPTAMMAAEMAVIRLTHVADLPPPEELVRRLTEGGGVVRSDPRGGGGGGGGPVARLVSVAGGARVVAAAPEPGLDAYARLEDVTGLLREERDIKLLHEVESFVRLVRYKPGLIEFSPSPGAPADLAGRLSQRLRGLTGARWQIAVSADEGQPTITEQGATAKAAENALAAEHPLVLAALEAFPGAEIRTVRPLGSAAEPEEFLAAVPEREFVEIEGDLLDSDDPFEEDI